MKPNSFDMSIGSCALDFDQQWNGLSDSKIGASPVPTKILIVEDNSFMRLRIRQLLQKHPDWEVCGEAHNGEEAIRLTEELNPDVVVMDFLMPEMNGLAAARKLNEREPRIPVLLFTLYISPGLAEEAKNAGLRGAVSKLSSGQLVEGVEALLRGHTYFPLSA
ncbi:MAG TPA: response regulator transcription factor [Terriglobales bacterium]|nr:response regulator transcription factor [Terriglobales bacterium]